MSKASVVLLILVLVFFISTVHYKEESASYQENSLDQRIEKVRVSLDLLVNYSRLQDQYLATLHNYSILQDDYLILLNHYLALLNQTESAWVTVLASNTTGR